MSEDHVTVKVATDLYESVKCRVTESDGEFRSVDDYIDFVLREVLREENDEQRNCSDEEQIKKRLKGLGYF